MTCQLRYALMDPSGNRTILVETPVPQASQPAAAAQLMALEPTAEQVGFWSDSEGVTLRMAGGEFCGNGTMSAAVLYALRGGMLQGEVLVRASGAPRPVSAAVLARTDGTWQGIVQMPPPYSVTEMLLPDRRRLPVVAFQGISHVILEQSLPRETAEALARRWCGYLGADALGLMFWNREEDRLSPLVYVPAADTMFWESACGSGSTAIGAWLASERDEPVEISLKQPGGVLTVTASPKKSFLMG